MHACMYAYVYESIYACMYVCIYTYVSHVTVLFSNKREVVMNHAQKNRALSSGYIALTSGKKHAHKLNRKIEEKKRGLKL